MADFVNYFLGDSPASLLQAEQAAHYTATNLVSKRLKGIQFKKKTHTKTHNKLQQIQFLLRAPESFRREQDSGGAAARQPYTRSQPTAGAMECTHRRTASPLQKEPRHKAALQM